MFYAMFMTILAFRATITYLLCRSLCEIYQDGVPYDQHGWIENFVAQMLWRKESIAVWLSKHYYCENSVNKSLKLCMMNSKGVTYSTVSFHSQKFKFLNPNFFNMIIQVTCSTITNLKCGTWLHVIWKIEIKVAH